VSLPCWGRHRGAPISLGLVSVSSVANCGVPCFLLFIFDLLCKRIASSPCIGSAVVALFIKRGESLFRGNLSDVHLKRGLGRAPSRWLDG
jgi:hypothetical protein